MLNLTADISHDSDKDDHEFTFEPSGLDAFLQKLPTTAVETILAMSNLPSSPKSPILRKHELGVRKWASQPSLRVPIINEEKERSDSPEMLAGISMDSRPRHIRTPSLGSLSSFVDENARRNRRYFVPLLHVLPEGHTMQAYVKNINARRVVCTSSSDIAAHSLLLSDKDGIMEAVVSNDESTHLRHQSCVPSLVDTHAEQSVENIVSLDDGIVTRSLERHQNSPQHQVRSAFDGLFESTIVSDEQVDIEHIVVKDRLIPSSLSVHNDVATILFPSLDFEASRLWMLQLAKMKNVLDTIQSMPVTRRGLLHRKEMPHSYDKFKRRMSLSSAWKAYMCELRGSFIFFYSLADFGVDGLKETTALPVAYLRLTSESVTDICYEYYVRKKKHVFNLWRRGIPKLMLPGKVALASQYSMDILQSQSEHVMVAWALAIREAVMSIPFIIDNNESQDPGRLRSKTLPLNDAVALFHRPRTLSFNE